MGKKNQIQLWNLRMLKNPYVFQVNGNCSDDNNTNNTDISILYSCKFNQKDSTFCVCGSNKNLFRIYDYKSLNMKDIKSVCSMDNMDFASYCCDFSSDGKLLSYGCADSMIRLISIK